MSTLADRLEEPEGIAPRIMSELQTMLEKAGQIGIEAEEGGKRTQGARRLDALVANTAAELLRLFREDEAKRLTWVRMFSQERGEA